MKKFRKIFFCYILDWHRVEKTGTDGNKVVGRCKDCERIFYKTITDEEWHLRDRRTTLERILSLLKVIIIIALIYGVFKLRYRRYILNDYK